MLFSMNDLAFGKNVIQSQECIENVTDSSMLRTNYGVACWGCGGYDLKLIGYEQAGIGGTTHNIYYKCNDCNGLTIVTMNAR